MPFTYNNTSAQQAADAARRAEEERKRKEEEARRKAEQQRKEAERKAAQDRAAQQSPQQKQQTPAAQPAKKAIPKKTGEVFKPSPSANPYYSQTDTRGQAIRNYRAKNLAPVHTQPGSYSVLSKDLSQMNWAERMAYGRLTGQGEDYYNALSQESSNPGYKVYDPYFENRSTLQWAIDAFNGQYQNFDDKFFQETMPLQDLEIRLPDTLNISKSGMANWTQAQLQAYARNKLEMAREDTEKGASEWSNLMTRAQDFYKTFELGYGRAPTAEEFEAQINMDDYPTLKKIDESRNIGAVGSSSPVILTRGIGYSHEKIPGLYEALRNGKTLDPSQDYTEDAIQHHMKWTFQPGPDTPKPAGRYTSDHANNAANMSPSMAAAAREEVRTVGNRQADAELTEALYAKDHPEYASYGIPPYTDDAYYAKMAPVFQPIIDANVQMDLNGQGTFPKPGKDDPPSVHQAYLFWQRWKKWEPDTKKVEAQWDAAVNRLKSWYGTFKNESDSGERDLVQELMNGSDWRDYPELAAFMEGSGKIGTTRPVYASEAALRGIIQALKDGQTEFSPDVDYAYYGGANKPAAQGAQKPVQGPASPDGRLAGEPRQTAPEAVQAPQAQPEQTTPAQQYPAGSTAAARSWAPGEGTTSLTGENKDDTRDMANIRPEEATLPKVNLEGLSESAIQLFKDQRLVTQEEIDAFKASQKTDESTGMVDAGAKGQSTTPEDVSKMSQEQVIDALKAVTAAQTTAQDPLNNTRKGAEMTAWMDEVQKLNDTYDILVDALHQFGMSDAEIEKALGPNLYSDNGEMIPVNAARKQKERQDAQAAADAEYAALEGETNKRWALELGADLAVDSAKANATMGDAVRQGKIDAVREQIRQLGINIPTDPVALKKRNAEMSGLYAKLGELDAGPTIGAAPTTPREEINAPDRLPRNLEDWRTGFIDTVKSFGKAVIENDAAIREKMQGVAKALVTNEAGKQAYPISTKAYDDLMAAHPDSPLTPQDWQQYYAVLDAENQGKTEAMPLEFMAQIDRMLPIDTPQFVKDTMAYSATIAGAVAERTNTEILTVTRNSAAVVQNAYLYSNRERYKSLLGEGYTLGQVRAIDPVADKLTAAVEQFDLGGQAMRTDYTKPLGEFAEPLLSVYEFALDQGLMMATTRGLAGGLHRAIAPVIAKALPYLEKLPGAVQKIASLSGTSALWILSNPHYMVRSYINGVDQARQDGATEEQANNVGLVMAATDGVVEAGIGTLYEGVFSKAVKFFGKALPGDIVKNLGAKGKNVLEYLGTMLSMAAGEAAEEITQAGINASAEQAIMGKPAGWNTVGDLVWDLASGHGYDAAKYENTLAGTMVNNASAAFVDSIGLGIIMGMGGRLSHATQAQAEYILDQIAKDPDFKKYLDEARALDAKSSEAPVAPAEAPQTASVATEGEKPAPEVKPVQEAPAAPVEADTPVTENPVTEPAIPDYESVFYVTGQEDAARWGNVDRGGVRKPGMMSPPAYEFESFDEAPPSPQAQMLVSFKQTAEKEIEEAAIKAETDARVQQEIDGGLLASTESPTNSTFFSILQADRMINELTASLQKIDAQIEQASTTMEKMVRSAFKNMVPVEAGNPQKISWNTTETIGRMGRDEEKVLEKIESAKAELRLLYEKWQAGRDEIKEQRKAEVEAEVRSEVSDVYTRRQTKSKAFRLSVTEGQKDRGEADADYIDALTRTPDEDNLGWVNESEEDPGWGNSRQKEEEETSWQTMDREKNEEVRAKGRGGAEGLDDKLANRRAALGTGGPKDGKGIPMVEVPKKVYDDMYKRYKNFLGNFMGPKSLGHIQGDRDSVSTNFATRNVQGAPSQYDLALKERNLKVQKPMKIKKMGYAGKDTLQWKKDRVSPNASMQVAPDKQQLTIERENLDESNKKLPNKVDTMSPVRRAWKEAGYRVVAQNKGYYILEDQNFTRKNLSLLGWQQDLEGIARDNGTDMSADINSVKQNLSPRYYVINRSFETDPSATNESGFPVGEMAKYNPEELAVYATTDMDEAMGVIDGKWQDTKVPRQGGTVYYVSRDVLSQFNEKFAALTEEDKAAMSYEEYSAMVSGMIDQYAQEQGLSEQERSKLYGAKNLFTKAGKDGWVAADSNNDYVLFVNENAYNRDPLVNANVKSVEQALATLRAAVNQQEDDRTGKKGNGEWKFDSYHSEKTRNPKFQPGGKKAPEGTYYTREGSVIYAYNFTDPKTGKITKLTAKLGAMDDTDAEYGRTFVPLEKILADAYAIDVNTFFGNYRVNFTLERNYGQARYGEFDQEIVTDEGGILRDMTREIDAFSRLIDDPDVALPMRQRFMRNLLDAQIKQTEKELYDLTESFRNGVINPGVNQAAVNQYAYLKERKATLAEMQKAIQGGIKAEGEAIGAASKKFFDSLKAVDTVENQITYDGMENDMAALDNTMKALAKADSPDMAKAAYEQLYLIKNRMEVALQHARRTQGGGALLAEYEWRIKSLDAKIKEVQADTSLPIETKALRVQELSAKMKRFTDYFYDMTSSGVDFTTPSQLSVENGSEATYNLEEMTLHNLVQLRESTRAKADKEARRAAMANVTDITQLRKYRMLLSDIDMAIKAKPLPMPSVSSTADGAVAADVKPEVRRGPTEKQPIVSAQAPIITSDQLPSKKARDTSYTRQGAIALLEDVLDAPIDEIDERLAKYMLPRLYTEAQGMLTAYAQDGVTSPDAMTDTLHEAEGILSNIANGLPPFPTVENQTEVRNETPVGGDGNVAESVADHPAVNAIINESEADETTKEEVKGHAKSVAMDLTVPVTHSEVLNASMDDNRTTPRNPPAEETPVGNEQPVQPVEEPALGPEGLPEYNGPAVLPKPTDVHSAREIVASFANELPVPMPEDENSALLRRIRAINEGKKPVEAEQEPAKVEKPKSLMARVTDSELEKRLKYYNGLEHEQFPVRPPRDMADVLGYRQRRYRLGQEISAMTKNIDKLADELKKLDLTDAQRDDLESKKAAIVVRRDSLKVINRLISKALKDEDAYQIQEFDEAITAARKFGKSIFIGQRSADRALVPENEMDQINKALDEMAYHERFGASKKTALDALMRTRTLKALAMNREIANAITAEMYRTQEEVDLLRQRVEALDTLSMLSEQPGAEAMWADANARRLEKQAAILESDIIRMQAAADLYYRDSSTDAETAIFGNSKSGGSLPTSIGHTIMTMAKQAIGNQAGIIRASGKWVGEVINRAIETNPERIVENFLGKYAPIFNRVYIDPVAEGNQKIKTTSQRFYDAIIKSGITMENEAIAHQYAEGRISFGELMAARPNDYKQIDEGIRVFRKIYDELIDDVNETLTRNGFAPVPKRKNYFPHFKDGAAGILSLIGLEENQDNIPLSMLGKTDEYRPLKQFVGNFLARKGNETDFGLITGAMRYIPSVLQVIHQTNNIVRLRQLEEMISQTDMNDLTPYQARRLGHFKQYMMNYTNNISGKKTGVDVLVGKSAIGREGLDFLRKIKQYRGLSLTFGSPTVILSQLVSLGVSVAVAPTATALAMAQMFHIVKDGDEAFNRDAFEARSQFLTRKYMGRPIPLTAWDTLMEKGQLPAEHLERIISNVFVRAVYLQNRREGMEDGPAMELADRMAWRALSSRNKGETGIAYGNVVGGTVLQFGREAVNNIMFMIKDMPKLSPDRRKNFARMALLLLYNWLFNWMTGKQTAFDPIGSAVDAFSNPQEGDTMLDTGKDAFLKMLDSGWPVSFDFTNGAQNLPVVAGARNIWTALSEFSFQDPTAYERLVSAAMGFFPGGAQIERTYRGIKTFAKGYSESNLGDVQFPVTQNPADLIAFTLLGTRAYGIGRWYRETNRKPLTNDQQEEFYKQYDAGITSIEAFDAAIGTPAATRQTIAAKNTTKMGDERGGYDQGKEAAKAREALGAPSGMPGWAYDDYASGDTRIKKAIKAYGSSDLTGLVPREVVDWVEQDGKRWEITEENRPYLEDRQQKWFRAYMDELGPNPTPQEVRNAISKADAKAKADFLNKYWAK